MEVWMVVLNGQTVAVSDGAGEVVFSGQLSTALRRLAEEMAENRKQARRITDLSAQVCELQAKIDYYQQQPVCSAPY